jgi:membrane protease subunit HflK
MTRSEWTHGPFDVGRGRHLRIPSLRGPSPRTLQILVGVIVALLLLLTSYYQIEPKEVGVVQRFGKHVRTSNPGPHFKIPFGVEQVTKVPVERQLKEEFGFRTERAGKETRYAESTVETTAEAIMLTGDLNVADVEWIVQYRIKDPVAYLFHVRDQIETLRYMSEAAVRVVVGDHSVDEVITIGREDVARLAQDELQRLCNLYGIGIEIQQLVLQNVNPPDPVKPAFNEVNEAIQEKERAINEAMAEYNQAVPRAKGEAEQAVRAAEGYATERVNNAQGDANRFDALYAEYRKAPNVTRKRIYLETMASIIPKMGRKLILDEKARGVLPLLQLDGQAKEVSQ